MTPNSLFRLLTLALALFVTSASYGRSPICGGGVQATSCESMNTQTTNTLSTKDISNLLSEADRLFRSGKKESAAQLGDLVLALVQKEYGSKSKEEALLLCYVANYYNDHNALKAIEYEQKALQMLNSIGDVKNDDFFYVYKGLAASYFRISDLKNSSLYTSKALDCAKITFGEQSDEYIDMLLQMGMYTNGEDKDRYAEEALKLAKQFYGDNSLQYADFLYRSNLKHDFLFMTSEEQSLYWTNTLQNNKLALLLNWKNLDNICASMADICFDAVLFSKGILLNSELDVNDAIRSNAKYQELYNEIKNDRSRLDQLTRQGLSETEAIVKRSEIYDKENMLVKKLSSESQYLRNFDLTVEDIKKRLGADEAAVEFYDDLGTYYAFVVSPAEQHVRVRKLCHEFDIESLKGKSCPQDSLYNLIWKPLEADLANAKRVFFSPTGKLYSLAIECTDAHSDKIYHRYSSLQRLCCPARRGLSGKAVVYGGINYDGSTSSPNTDKHTANQNNASRQRGTMDYLPASYSEACEVSRLLRKQGMSVTLLSGDAATEKSFADLSHASVDILHISTHGFCWSADKYEKLVSENPYLNQGKKFTLMEDAAMARTGLIFAGANAVFSHNATSPSDNDGIVSAKDICFLDFKGIDMVVLSACKTGLGDVSYEGVFGLQRAFKKAGASSIVMSLWNVDDNVTQEFMVQLYSNLGQGYTKEAAIENARRKLKTKHPDFKDWAAFVLLD